MARSRNKRKRRSGQIKQNSRSPKKTVDITKHRVLRSKINVNKQKDRSFMGNRSVNEEIHTVAYKQFLANLSQVDNKRNSKNKKKAKTQSTNLTSSLVTTSVAKPLLEKPQFGCIVEAQNQNQIQIPTQSHVKTFTQSKSHSSDSESDCEIIEDVTPVIVLDEDFTDEPESTVNDTVTSSTDITSSNKTTSSIERVDSSVISVACLSETEKSVESASKSETEPQPESHQESEQQPQPQPEQQQPPAEIPLFYIDKNPGTTFEAPIYEVNSDLTSNQTDKMPPKVQNIRIVGPVSLANKENLVADEIFFTPNPMLSSTRLNDLLDENANSPNDDISIPANNLHISINSTCEPGDTTRTVFASQKSPNSSGERLANISNNNIIDTPKSRKRKAQQNIDKDPPTKKCSTTDVIVLNDTVSDAEEDSVVFVSETVEKRQRNAILARTNRHKALDYISLGNDSGNQKKPQSTRAKRRMEKKQLGKERAAQAKLSNGKSKQQNGVKNKSINRFDVQNPSTSFQTYASIMSKSTSTATTGSPESKRATQKKLILQYEKEKQLFKEKPDLFEKRMIIIDGSNVACTHGVRDKSYSIKGIQLCIKHFEDRGFKVKAVVPQRRLKRSQSTDPDALERMVNAGKIIVTPCKNLPGSRSSSYDDRFILDAAEQFDAAIISNDNYADLLQEKPEWNEIIRERVVGFSWCDDYIMIPQDPYGKNGKTLQLILHKLKADAIVDEKYISK